MYFKIIHKVHGKTRNAGTVHEAKENKYIKRYKDKVTVKQDIRKHTY